MFDDYKSGDVIRISILKNGKRQAPKKMGEVVNTGIWEAFASVTSDGKYMLFNRYIDDSSKNEKMNHVDIYWIDAQIIETLRPK